jgi:carbamoyl-phosphate synthase small subunit
MRGIISTLDLDPDRLVHRVREEVPDMNGLDLVPLVTCSYPYWWDEGLVGAGSPRPQNVEQPPLPVGARRAVPTDTSDSPGFQPGFRSGTGFQPVPFDQLKALWNQRPGKKVILYDYGVKFNIIRSLKARGLEVLVVPATTPAEDILKLNPDGIVLSNGPGDPAAVTYAIENVRQCLGQKPMFGICLGHQLMGLALGGRTFKLKFGHRGANQPVKNTITGRVEITSQNHGFAVDIDSIPDPAVELTHFNLNDNTLEGLRHPKLACFSVQYHPEASPGPHDANYLFDEFINLLL